MNEDVEPPQDELSQLQLRVARRADELARDSGFTTPLNISCWMRAESEIFGPPGSTAAPGIAKPSATGDLPSGALACGAAPSA